MNLHQSRGKSLIALIVIYKRRVAESETFRTLLSSCEHCDVPLDIILYDNSPVADPSISDNRFSESGCEVSYFNNPQNPGLACAYNYALECARNLRKKYVIYFDQDSSLEASFLNKVISSITTFPDIQLHLPIVRSTGRQVSPVKTCLGRDIGPRGIAIGINSERNFFAINSGMVISTKYLTAIGGYDVRFALYGTDNWFCEKYSEMRLPFALFDAVVTHDFARDTCVDASRKLIIYSEYLRSQRLLYEAKPLTLSVLWLFGLGGAVKHAITERNLGYLKTFFSLSK